MRNENLALAHSGNYSAIDPSIAYLLESPLIKGTEVIGTREGGIVDCWVPTELIDHEEVPVKDIWARSLANDMRGLAETKGGTGQLSPVILGLIDGQDKLRIIDGFHRDAALRMNGETSIYSAVQLTDWDGLYDTRILTAKDHAHVRFSRVVQWIREVWAYSNLDDKMTLEQAILLYRFESSGAKLGLSSQDVEAANAWVKRKEKQWSMAAMTIHSHLKVAETVDPKLVHAAREKKRSDALEAPTQVILTMFAEQIPNKFDLQNLVMQAAMQQNLTGPEVRSLSASVSGMELDEAQAAIASIDWDNWEPRYGEKKQRALRRAHDARIKGAAVFNKAGWEIQGVLQRARQVAERGEKVEEEMVDNVQAAIERALSLRAELGSTAIELGLLVERDVRIAEEDLGSDMPIEGQLTLEYPFEEIPVAEEQVEEPVMHDFADEEVPEPEEPIVLELADEVSLETEGSLDETIEHVRIPQPKPRKILTRVPTPRPDPERRAALPPPRQRVDWERPPDNPVKKPETADDGLRKDIMAYLKGESNINSVNPFNRKQLVQCFRTMEDVRPQPKDWKNRFSQIQQSGLYTIDRA